MSEREDIVQRLLDGVNDDGRLDTLHDEAARHIVELRQRLVELGASVRTSRTKSEAVSAAKRLAPLSISDVLLNGFHKVELAWREMK